MFAAETLKYFAFGLVAVILIVGAISDWFRKHQAKTKFSGQLTFDDKQFQSTFYGNNAKLADIALRVRKVLARNLEMSLESLQPEHRLNNDLNAQMEANPDIFWELEDEFGITTHYDDFNVFEKTVEELTTFSDLVEYVRSKLDQAVDEKPRKEAKETLTARVYDRLASVVPPICVGGVAFAFIGGFLRYEIAYRIGSGVFMLGLVLLIISVFSVGIENLTTEMRAQGRIWVREHPIRTAWIGFIILAMLYMSFAMLRWLLRVFTSAI